MSDPFSKFKQRLEALKSGTSVSNAVKITRKQLVLPGGWVQTDELVFRRTVRTRHSLPLYNPDSLLFESNSINTSDIVFFDLETTGLSGGAGTVFFLAGIATLEGEDLVLHQFFLADYPGENEFLRQVLDAFNPEKIYVSYNGKVFDTHVIKSRIAMHGMEVSMENQIDLLYLTRRFWKRVIGSCTLSDIESKVLGIRRERDIPGYLIPDAYFGFLRTGDTTEIADVFLHNESDILSLVRLFRILCEITSGNDLDITRSFGPDFPVDKAALGRYFLLRKPEKAAALLTDAFEKGDYYAGRVLAGFHKKNREWKKAQDSWQKLWVLKKTTGTAVELAKYYEHIAGDFQEALNWAMYPRALSLPLNPGEEKELARRIARIKRKLGSE